MLEQPAAAAALAELPRTLVVDAVREELAEERTRLRGTRGDAVAAIGTIAMRAAARAHAARRPLLRRVLNATGVVLHTNLGRAPLAAAALAAVQDAGRGYSSLEFDLERGRRGDRGLGLERWLRRLTGAEAALAVNNGAGAILLVLSALASGRRVIVSRGELVEIGGSFRVPDVLEKSGATLLEVGTTNRTHLSDYEKAFAKHDDVGAILRVHRSNFRIAGFTAQPEIAELAALARKRRVPLIEDLGSGALVDLAAFGLEREPTVEESLAHGCDVVTFSGDKLLGGSQAGLIVGRNKWVEKARKDPLARALRLDKLAIAALEATLPLYADPAAAIAAIPALAMLRVSADELEPRARRLAKLIEAAVPGLTAGVARGAGEVGGGALPLQKLESWIVEVRHVSLSAQELERRARAADPAVIGTVKAGAFRLDPRTLPGADLDEAAGALAQAWRAGDVATLR